MAFRSAWLTTEIKQRLPSSMAHLGVEVGTSFAWPIDLGFSLVCRDQTCQSWRVLAVTGPSTIFAKS